MISKNRKILTTAFISSALLMGPGLVTAQDVPTADESVVEEVMVTGSRIKRKDLTSVGPITVITEEQIKETGITNLEVLLQRLPSVAGYGGNQTGAYWVAGGWGTTQVNLRGLGVTRTLVLLNGRRVVFGGSGANTSVDLSMIPMSLIERIEVLKDGASAIYGADAVAGVINLITKTEYEGVGVEAKYGMTDEGDGEQLSANLSWGINSDEGNLMVNVSFVDNKASPLADSSRAPCPLFPDSSGKLVCGGSSSTIGGRTTLPAGAFWPDGTMITTPTRTNFNQILGGDGDFYAPYNAATDSFNYNPYFNAVNPTKQLSFSAFGKYNITDNIRLFSELIFTNRQSDQIGSPATLVNVFYSADHPTNPTGVDFNLERRRLLENGARYFSQDVNTFRIVTGLEGAFKEDWFYDVSFNFGRNTATDAIENNINMGRFAQTLDTSVCGSAGVPCGDYIGYGEVTQEVLDYIVFNQTDTGGNEQRALAANISNSNIFELPAGPVGFAAGIEWREEEGWLNPDSLAAAGLALGNIQDPISGKIESKEIYTELQFPLLRDKPMVKSLDLDLAYRFSDYDLFDSSSDYRIGLNWQISTAIKVRGTFSTAFRVPNIPELFGGISQGNLTTLDPCSGWSSLSPSDVVYQNCQAAGVPVGYTQLGNTVLTDGGGNPNLQPESAETTTIGVVLQPIDNLSLTVDYWKVDITDGIRSTPGSTKLANCYQSPNLSNEFCSPTHHTRDPLTGDIDYLSTQLTNTGSEDMEGIDMSIAYGFDAWGLSNVFDFNTTYLMKYESVAFDGDVPTVFDGFIGGGNGGYPEWRFNTSFTTTGEKWGGTYSIQMIGSADDFYVTEGPGSHMPAVFYHDIQGTYTFSENARLAAGINNLFQEDPPYVASWTDGNTDTMTYDLAGRRFYVRLEYHWN